jgi:predicted nucleotidyltransferase
MTINSPKVEVSEEVITSFCARWNITKFALFASILWDDFRPDSDVDVLVTFASDAKWSLWNIIKMK